MTDENFNLIELTTKISRELLDSIYIIDIIYEISDGDGKIGTLLSILKNNITSAFDETEKCRKII